MIPSGARGVRNPYLIVVFESECIPVRPLCFHDKKSACLLNQAHFVAILCFLYLPSWEL